MITTKSTKYRNTLKVSHADSYGLKVLGKIEFPVNHNKQFVVEIFQCKTLKYIDEFICVITSDNIDEIYRQIKYKYSQKLKPNTFFTVSYL